LEEHHIIRVPVVNKGDIPTPCLRENQAEIAPGLVLANTPNVTNSMAKKNYSASSRILEKRYTR